MRNDRNGMTTATALVIVVLLVGGSMLAFNEWERTTLKQQALTQTTADIIVGNYKYNFSALQRVPNMASNLGSWSSGNIQAYGDKILYFGYKTNYPNILGGYNITSGTHFIIAQSTTHAFIYCGIDRTMVTYDDYNTIAGGDVAKAYIWSNGTTWTSPSCSYGHYSTVAAGSRMAYVPYMGYKGWANISVFNTTNWKTTIVKSVILTSPSEYIFLENGGDSDNIIYSMYVTGSNAQMGTYMLNVVTGATISITSSSNPYVRSTCGIAENTFGYVDTTAHKMKAMNFRNGRSYDIDNITYGGGYEFHQAISNWNDTFFPYFIIDSQNENHIYMRMYDTTTKSRFQVADTSVSVGNGVNGIAATNSMVAMRFGTNSPDMFYYTYTRTPYKTTANVTNQTGGKNGAANQTAQTTLEKASSFLTSNWIYVAVGIGIVGVIGYFAFRKYRASPKYREVGAKNTANIGIVLSIVAIVVIAVLFMV